jgi:DNA (cytosine-5)-methyltransferase 1
MHKITHYGFFEGIGGFSIGAQRAGIETVYWCEKNPSCRKYLLKQYPNVAYDFDIQKAKNIPTGSEGDTRIFTAGFPCQDISNAKGKERKGIDGKRSGLFWTFFDIVRVHRPEYIIIENSANLLTISGGDQFIRVINAFVSIGYICEWTCLCAYQFGLPHKRKRLYLVAYSDEIRLQMLLYGHQETLPLYEKRLSDEVKTLLSARRNDSFPDIDNIPRDDGFRGQWLIGALGNAVVPTICHYLFDLIKKDANVHK